MRKKSFDNYLGTTQEIIRFARSEPFARVVELVSRIPRQYVADTLKDLRLRVYKYTIDLLPRWKIATACYVLYGTQIDRYYFSYLENIFLVEHDTAAQQSWHELLEILRDYLPRVAQRAHDKFLSENPQCNQMPSTADSVCSADVTSKKKRTRSTSAASESKPRKTKTAPRSRGQSSQAEEKPKRKSRSCASTA